MKLDQQVCPWWCTKEHRGVEVTSHEGEVHRVELFGGDRGDQFLEIRSVQYLPIDLGDPLSAVAPMVEVAHHSGHRYRVFNLTGDSARALASVLLASAAAIDGGQPASEV